MMSWLNKLGWILLALDLGLMDSIFWFVNNHGTGCYQFPFFSMIGCQSPARSWEIAFILAIAAAAMIDLGREPKKLSHHWAPASGEGRKPVNPASSAADTSEQTTASRFLSRLLSRSPGVAGPARGALDPAGRVSNKAQTGRLPSFKMPRGTILLLSLTLLSLFASRIPPAHAVTSQDYQTFIAPYASRLESLRAYMMLPPDPTRAVHPKIGINSVYSLVQGDYVCGGYKPLASSLNNNDLLASKDLDYLNLQQGIHSAIENSTRFWLSQTWNNTMPVGFAGGTGPYASSWACTHITALATWTYPCLDKHELEFGTGSPCMTKILASCALSAGEEAFITSQAGITMIVESGVNGSCLSSAKTSLNDLAPYINWLWLHNAGGERAQAVSLFNATITNWTPTAGTGYGNSVGGCFSAPYGPNPTSNVAKVRDLGFWLDTARATGLWNSSSLALSVTQQVLNQLWGMQQPTGEIAVDYPANSPAPCGFPSSTYPKDSGESDGVTLAAFDVRLPCWFGTLQSCTTGSTSGGTVNNTTNYTTIAAVAGVATAGGVGAIALRARRYRPGRRA